MNIIEALNNTETKELIETIEDILISLEDKPNDQVLLDALETTKNDLSKLGYDYKH